MFRTFVPLIPLAVFLSAAGCSGESGSPDGSHAADGTDSGAIPDAGADAADAGAMNDTGPFNGIALVTVASGLQNPLYLTAPKGDPRLFIVEQYGRIRIVKGGVLLSSPFLDVSAEILAGGERGLLGLAFHPDYAANGYFYVNFTDVNGDTNVRRYTVSVNPDAADPGSGKPILFVKQPFTNHNGGNVLFGPDGHLYIGMGDGGSGGDPQGIGQNRNTLLGKLLRVDVDKGDPYAIPSDNPFAGQPGMKGEIWAYGLRNPWRFSFDTGAGLLYIADVGQDLWEEVDVSPITSAGLNYGWNVMEGNHCYAAAACNEAGLAPPVLEYSHPDGCSITGGFVYRGNEIPEIAGRYFYSDYCLGWIRSFRFDGIGATEQKQWPVGTIGHVLSFGQDSVNGLYVLSDNGNVYKIVRAP